MNLRAKKENINPCNVLKDQTNVRRTQATKILATKTENTRISKVKIRDNSPKKARKPKSKQLNKKSITAISEENEMKPSHHVHCFGFSDEDDLDADIAPYDGTLSKFDNGKPYRLSLYVRPSQNKRFDLNLVQKIQNWSTMNLTNAAINVSAIHAPSKQNSTFQKNLASETVMSPDRTQWKVPLCSTPKESSKKLTDFSQNKMVPPRKRKVIKALVQKKITDLLSPSSKRTRSGNSSVQQMPSLFEPFSSSEDEVQPLKCKEAKKVHGIVQKKECESSDDDHGKNVQDQLITRLQKPSRRSYIKKQQPLVEPEDDTPTEVVLKSIKKTKTTEKTTKKDKKEEEEFETWSRSMNSQFDEIEKFEMSFG